MDVQDTLRIGLQQVSRYLEQESGQDDVVRVQVGQGCGKGGLLSLI